jgi:SHS2 domain-containing protein
VYRWIEHTGELELAIDAPTEPAVFADALVAFAELVADDGSLDGERREIELRADGREALLADWLDELVYLADVERFVPEHLTDLELEGDSLRAIVRGHRGEPRPLVKAITRHRLTFEPDEDVGWRARVVLDV